MNRSPKLINSPSYITPKAQPLTLKEVLQLRDGREISKNSYSTVSQSTTFSPILQNINYLNSLN